MRQAKRFLTLILLVFATLSFSQTKQSDTTRILFIGNSYTYFNSVPELLKALAKEKFPDQVMETQLISQGGMTLERHWQEDKALQAIRSGHWDYVVLQEQSKLGMGVIIDDRIYFGQTNLFFEYSRKFDAEIKKADAKTVFFMTWSIKDRPEEQVILIYAYSKIAKELGAILAPVGMVWDKVRSEDQIDLYFRDGAHPSAHGSYLAATTIFATLLEDSPVNLSGKISGKQLASTGEPSLESQPLTDISTVDAKVIQEASWAVVESMQKTGNYPEVQEPKQSYTIPFVTKGESINHKSIVGRWYGTSTYSSNYLGLILDVESLDDNLEANLSFYSPDRQDRMTMQDANLETNQLHLTIVDSLRRLSSNVKFSLTEGQMSGISKSFGGNITQYKHWNLSRQNMQNGVDLAAVDLLTQSFQLDIEKNGYVEAALNHYKQYSKLIGKTYKPEEMYLNAMGYNLLRDKRLKNALNLFELAMTLYPQSVNTYDSYGEALVEAGQKEKAIKIYAMGYELAKKTGDKNLSYIEANLKKLKQDVPITQQITPPPPRPQ